MNTHRTLVFLACILVAGCASAPQGIFVESDAVIATDAERTIAHVGEAKGTTKDQLFSTARIWLAETFRSSKAVIDLEDKAEGVIVGNAAMPYPKTGCEGLYCSVIADWQVHFKIRIDVKDDRYRISFTDLELFLPATYGSFATPSMRRPMTYQKELALCRTDLLALAGSLSGYTSKAAAAKAW